MKKIIDALSGFTKPGKTLSQRAVKSSIWVFLLRVVQQLFSLAKLVILARLLTPKDFGIMGLALLVMATLDTFSQTGFQQALIQKKCDVKPYMDSAWTYLILRGLVIFALLYSIAPYAAIFFDTPEAKPIIQVIGFSAIFQAFTNIGVIYFQKELEFNKQFIYQLSSTLTDFVVSIVAFFILGNVWALVFGMLAGNAAMLITSYFVHSYRPHLDFNIEKLKQLSSYGKWIFGSSILVFLLTQGDDMVVGKMLGITALGFYQMAYRISNLPATEICHVISQVTFPVYSKIQDDITKLREAYLGVLKFTAFITFPISGFIFVLAPNFTQIFLGEKWMPMVPAIQFLVIFGITRVINATTGPVLQAIHRPEVSTFGSSIQLIVFIIFIYPLTDKFGIVGTCISAIIPNIFFMFYIGKRLINIMNYKLNHLINSLIPPILGTAITVSFIFIYKCIISTALSFVSVIVVIFVGFFVYLLTVVLLDKLFNYEFIDTFKKLISSAMIK